MNENEDDDLLIFEDFELVEDQELSILHTKKKEQAEYYIEFDVFTREVTEISPIQITQTRSFRHNIFVKKEDDILKKILYSKLPPSKVKAWFNPITNEHDLVVSARRRKNAEQFFFVQNKKDVAGPIHLDCDLIRKCVRVTFSSEEFKKYISSVTRDEEEMQLDNEIKFYCFHENNPTLLYGSFVVAVSELLENHQVTIPCHWFPNEHRDFENYVFMHMGANFNISFGLTQPEAKVEDVQLERPQILYKQEGSTVSFQSIMNNAANYKIQDTVNFYCYQEDDPSKLLFKLKVPKEELDKFNSFSVKLHFEDKIKILSDHAHLYIEDNDVSTYYKF